VRPRRTYSTHRRIHNDACSIHNILLLLYKTINNSLVLDMTYYVCAHLTHVYKNVCIYQQLTCVHKIRDGISMHYVRFLLFMTTDVLVRKSVSRRYRAYIQGILFLMVYFIFKSVFQSCSGYYFTRELKFKSCTSRFYPSFINIVYNVLQLFWTRGLQPFIIHGGPNLRYISSIVGRTILLFCEGIYARRDEI